MDGPIATTFPMEKSLPTVNNNIFWLTIAFFLATDATFFHSN